VGSDDFILDLIGPLLLQFVLLNATSVLSQVSVGFDLGNSEIGLSSDLLQIA
jgi:hypothetical protein